MLGPITRNLFAKTAGHVRRSFAFLLLAFGSAAFAGSSGSSADALLAGGQLQRLDAAITLYKGLVEQGGWQPLGDGPVLISGNRHPDVRLIRQRLQLTGDVRQETEADPLLFDTGLTKAVMRFQARHGLDATGIVDHQSRTLLGYSVEQVLAQLQYARANWATVKTDPERQVFVNIPEARVFAIEGEQIVFSMKAIVGHPSRPTPELSSAIRSVVVNPSWTVPRSIAVNDILPQQQADPTYLERNAIRVFDARNSTGQVTSADIDWDKLGENNFPYRLRQDPGPNNSLGRYKFEFPNSYDVYLHDTPGQGLLGLSYRSLSSGCVRLEEPEVLAEWLARSGSEQALEQAETAAGYVTRAIRVPQAVPVELVYLNAWVAQDGSVQFRYDIYDRVRVARQGLVQR